MEVRDSSRASTANEKDKSIKLCETRVQLSNIGSFKCYKLSKSSTSAVESDAVEVGRIFIRINKMENPILNAIAEKELNFFPLSRVLPPTVAIYRHLYVDVDWNPNGFLYSGGLPGPIAGELAVDRYNNVEVA